jgi:glycerol-3-phosphate dehydrogenase
MPDLVSQNQSEFSFRTREKSLERMQNQEFDFLVIGGGITGAAVARDAASRGLSVAVVEARDYAWGTSSRSSKLIHGGLRYLENFEFHLVFESLAERAFLMWSAPNRVRPLPFYLPAFEGDKLPLWIYDLGLWLYDFLALLRTPGFHKRLSKKKLLSEIPFLRTTGLKGGLRYYDASMWDDVLAVDTLRTAGELGVASANYCEAVSPIFSTETETDTATATDKSLIKGFECRDLLTGNRFNVRAKKTIVCVGPWVDLFGQKLSPRWKNWLSPSKGVHIVFDLKRIPVPGAVVMTHPEDGRISFVIPRTDLGGGVVIVGTTDGPAPHEPEKLTITNDDVDYLMGLLNRYFPDLKLTNDDILSAYVGIRPLVGPNASSSEDATQIVSQAEKLQKISREHHIGNGPGGAVVVAGGKYTTHRKMAEEIVDYALRTFDKPGVGRSRTRIPLDFGALPEAVRKAMIAADGQGLKIPDQLWERYGSRALSLSKLRTSEDDIYEESHPDPEGFPWIAAQLRFSIRFEMTLKLEDFYFRRVPLFLGRKDHGLPWAKHLSEIWAKELGKTPQDAQQEVEALKAEIEKRSSWLK